MSIPFTQYLRPHGRQKPISIERSEDIEKKAKTIIEAGFRFEAEELMTGQVSLSIHEIKTEEDVAIEVVQNGPPVPEAVDRMITNFYAERFSADG